MSFHARRERKERALIVDGTVAATIPVQKAIRVHTDLYLLYYAFSLPFAPKQMLKHLSLFLSLACFLLLSFIFLSDLKDDFLSLSLSVSLWNRNKTKEILNQQNNEYISEHSIIAG